MANLSKSEKGKLLLRSLFSVAPLMTEQEIDVFANFLLKVAKRIEKESMESEE